MKVDFQKDLRKETVKEHFTDNAAYWDDLYSEDFSVNRFYSHEIKSRKKVVFIGAGHFMRSILPYFTKCADLEMIFEPL